MWSAAPTHEAIVPRETFDAVEERARGERQFVAAGDTEAVPGRRRGRPGRLYVLRGRVRCSICGRRMEGSHQKGSNWYRCQYAQAAVGGCGRWPATRVCSASRRTWCSMPCAVHGRATFRARAPASSQRGAGSARRRGSLAKSTSPNSRAAARRGEARSSKPSVDNRCALRSMRAPSIRWCKLATQRD